jgi:hypothetical protein
MADRGAGTQPIFDKVAASESRTAHDAVAFARYSRDGSFVVLRRNARLAVVLAPGSVTGTVLGGLAGQPVRPRGPQRRLPTS